MHTKHLHNVQAKRTIGNMKNKVDGLRIDPKRIYTLTEIEGLHLIPWAKNGRTIRKIISQDSRGPKTLKARVTGAGSQKRYTVPGSGIKSYLQTYGPFLIGTVRNTQKTHARNKTKS